MTPDRGGRSTRDIILDKAEELFAEYGIQAVSVRRVLSEAGVNAALAHYHFGDRQGLIREVLSRRIEPLNRRRLELLRQATVAASPGAPVLGDVLRAFFAPLVELLDRERKFARLIGQVHVSAEPKLRGLFTDLFREVVLSFAGPVRDALPAGLSGSRRLARAHFMMGVMVLTLTNYEDMELLSGGRYEIPAGEVLLDEMVTFCAAGLLTPPPQED